MNKSTHAEIYMKEVSEIAQQIDYNKISKIALKLKNLRDNNGRLFFIGVGGSAANCSHAVNDFRKICEIETYTPTDNVSELTARTNDEGWDTTFSEWLRISNANEKDAIFVLSVGGGSSKNNISLNIVKAIDEALVRNMTVFGIVGKSEGHTQQNGHLVVTIPTMSEERITPHSEAFQAVIWHCLVSDPVLAKKITKWESIDNN